MNRFSRYIFGFALAFECLVFAPRLAEGGAAEMATSAIRQMPWGRVVPQTNGTGNVLLEVDSWAYGGRLTIPAPFPNITAVFTENGSTFNWRFNGDSSLLELDALGPSEAGPQRIILETAEDSRQFAEGRITFSALDATVEGSTAKLESTPGHHRIAFGSDARDAVSWNYKPTRWGSYEVRVAFSMEGAEGMEVGLSVAGKTFAWRPETTGGGSKYRRDLVGHLTLSNSEPFTVRMQCMKPLNKRVLNLKAVTLTPASEGRIPVSSPSQPITLHASNAITHSVLMRYEPQTNKNCLGYWANPTDWAEWIFPMPQPGSYDLEVWQGCGKGQGGSDVVVEILGQWFPFVVEDTGHFQNFIPRKLGQVRLESGPLYLSLKIKPQRKKAAAVMDIKMVRLIPSAQTARASDPNLLQTGRVVFVGDSITHAGDYIEFVEAYLRMRYPTNRFDFINLGLPSETVSGLSEPGHAGGSFPRPDLHERLERLLEKTKPALIVACYGMNDGIYYPFAQERFEAFQKGMTRLREKAEAAGAKVIHLTPPVFDPVPLQGKTLPAGLNEYRSPFEGYDLVLERYAEWLMGQRDKDWAVIDLHAPLKQFLSIQRHNDPKFLLAGDGVHANKQGHWLMAREILRRIAAPERLLTNDTSDALLAMHPRASEVLELVQQRLRVLKDAWLAAVGHQRPGMSKGKPLPEAEREARELEKQLQTILNSPPNPATGLFARSNLVAWCIVPFDAKKRGPDERAAMLRQLNLKKFAYDYRAEHIPTFEAEIAAVKREGVELSAWWFPSVMNDEAKGILTLLARHQLHPQLWVTGGGGPTTNAAQQAERVASEVRRLQPIAQAAATIGCTVGLYNHGGWFGEPENQIAIIKALHTQNLTNVGIIYNQHHGHEHIDRFAALLETMKPWLWTLNLNGMTRDATQNKILPLGQGEFDLPLLKIIRDSGWRGPLGILNHTEADAEARLRDNLEGLDWLVAQLNGQEAGPKPQPRSWSKPTNHSAKAESISDYWAVEDKTTREKLPLYKTIPAALPQDLTPANGYPRKETFVNWHRSHGDSGAARYSALDQINRSNVNKLQVAWTYHGKDGVGNIQCNPVIAQGIPGVGWRSMKWVA